MITVATGSVLRGDMIATGTVQVDGRIEGRIVCSRLEVGCDGYVQGDCEAREVIIEGQIVGHVSAVSVALEDGAFVEGEVRYASISLASGATMTGKAVRVSGDFVPAALAKLEAEVSAFDAEMDDMETQTREKMAKRAKAEYPAYEQLRWSIVGSR